MTNCPAHVFGFVDCPGKDESVGGVGVVDEVVAKCGAVEGLDEGVEGDVGFHGAENVACGEDAGADEADGEVGQVFVAEREICWLGSIN